MILVDIRESKSPVPRFLDKLGAKYEFVELEIGDYVVGEVVVERKNVNDYVASLTSGRLANQLYQLSYHYPISVLIVEGYIDEVLYYRKIKRQTYISSLAGSLLKRAPEGERGIINLVMVTSPFDTAVFLKYLHEKWSKGEPRLPVITKKKAVNEKERALMILSSLPGISEVRAEKLLNHFKSVKAVFNASTEELMRVEGIGRKTAESIYRIIRGVFE